MMDCGLCGGDGECIYCGGEGTFFTRDENNELTEIECPACDGTGACGSCDGTGEEK